MDSTGRGQLEGGGQRADSQLQDTGALGCGGPQVGFAQPSLGPPGRVLRADAELSPLRRGLPAFCLLYERRWMLPESAWGHIPAV